MCQDYDTQEFQRRFKITCLKCGSDDVAVTYDRGWAGTDVTAGDPVKLVIGCNTCKQNDFDFNN